MEITILLEYNDRKQLREWLEANHETAKDCWVTVNRSKLVRADCMSYPEAVEEALCFGWIDSTLKRMPDGRYAQRLSPRRKNSHWTENNRRRCNELLARGLMTDSGLKALGSKE